MDTVAQVTFSPRVHHKCARWWLKAGFATRANWSLRRCVATWNRTNLSVGALHTGGCRMGSAWPRLTNVWSQSVMPGLSSTSTS